jgi:hypothetical protein
MLKTAFAQELCPMKFSKQIGLYSVLFLLGIFYPVTGFTSAPQAEITHLVIKNTADSLLVDMKIDSESTPEMKADVLNSVPVRITISLSLYEVHNFWFDRKAAAIKVVHELRYDALKKVYKITSSRGMLRPTYVEDFDTARQLISEINNLEVIALRDLKKGEQYQLMVGTVLSLKKYPLFNLYREFKTDRYTVNFIY